MSTVIFNGPARRQFVVPHLGAGLRITPYSNLGGGILVLAPSEVDYDQVTNTITAPAGALVVRSNSESLTGNPSLTPAFPHPTLVVASVGSVGPYTGSAEGFLDACEGEGIPVVRAETDYGAATLTDVLGWPPPSPGLVVHGFYIAQGSGSARVRVESLPHPEE